MNEILAYIPQTQKSNVKSRLSNVKSKTFMSKGNPKRKCEGGLNKNVFNRTSKDHKKN